MRKVSALVFFLFSFVSSLFAQGGNEGIYTEMIFSVRGAIHVHHSPYYELGGYLAFTHDDGSDGPAGWFGTFFSIDNSFNGAPENNGKKVFGWRAGAEYNMAFPWGFRCSVAGYRANEKQALRLCPEAGLSIYCLHIYLGYNIPLTNTRLVRNTGPQLSLIMGIPVYVHEFYRKSPENLRSFRSGK